MAVKELFCRIKRLCRPAPLLAASCLAPLAQSARAAEASALPSTYWLAGLASAAILALGAAAIEQLRRAARRQRRLFETAPLAMVVWSSPEYLIHDWNPAAEQLFGWRREEVLGHNFLDVLLPAEERQRMQEMAARISTSGAMQQASSRNLSQAGGQLTCEWHHSLYSDKPGRVRLISTANDISERRRIEKALREHEATLRHLFDNSMVGIIALSDELLITECNPALADMLGYRREELLGRALEQLLLAEDLPLQQPILAQMCAGQRENYRLTQRYRHRQGNIIHVQIDVHCVRREEGCVDHFVGIVDDISIRQQTEEKLLASEQRQRKIVDELPLAMMLTSAGRIDYVNSKLTALLGYQQEDIPSLEAWSLLAYPDPDYRSFAVKAADKLMEVAQRKGRTNIPIELRVRAKSGSDLEIEYLYADFGDFGIWTLNDVTERNRSEQALLQANLHLQDQLAEIRQLQEKLRDQAIRDALTGLYNRRYLDETMERELSRAQREGYPVTVAMIDIDFFKKLNDTYGHQAGDEMLKELGALLKKGARMADVPCRYGGEEFMLVLPNMPLEVAHQRAEIWRDSFKALRVNFGQFELHSTISIGLATYPGHGKSRDALIEAADQALYIAKHGGRDQVVIFTPPTA
jgi:diguanylate cyclase (GGDEF)-like protein/PAS domain S-box-containing protein